MNNISMRSLFRVLLIILSLSILSGCASIANYKKAVDTWNGKTENQLVAVWGYPDNMIKSPSGENVYVYNSSVAGTFYKATCEGDNCQPLRSITDCTTWFELNNQKVITQVTFRGVGCKYGDNNDLKAIE